MDLKNRVHSHVLAPGTKSTAPKHGSVVFFWHPNWSPICFFWLFAIYGFWRSRSPPGAQKSRPRSSGIVKRWDITKSEKKCSGEARGPKKYWKTQHICNMDLKNRAHSHVLAPDTKSTAPKHGSVGIFQKLGARGGKFPATSTIFRSKKGTFCNLNCYTKCTILRLSRLAQLIDVNGSAPGPTFPAPDTKMTLVCSPQTPSNNTIYIILCIWY